MSISINGLTGISGVDGTSGTPAFKGNDTNTGVSFGTDTVTINTGGVARVTTDASGNVGVGVTPSAWSGGFIGLQVKTAALASFSSGAYTFLGSNWYNNSGSKYIGTGSATLYEQSAGAHVWSTAPSGTAGNAIIFTPSMTLTAAGSLLIGTNATSNTDGVLIGKGGAAAGGIVVLMKTNSGVTNALLNFHQTTYVGGINFDNTSTSFPTSSDIRLKKDIVDSPSATQKIDNIRIVSHGWKHDDAVVEFGVIAQDLVSVAPNAVMQGDDGEEVVTTWSVDYSKLVPLLIKAHQEQQAIIQSLTSRLEALENK